MPPGRSVPSYGQAPAAGRSRLPSRARLPGSSIKVQYIPYTVQRTGTFTPYDGTVLATVIYCKYWRYTLPFTTALARRRLEACRCTGTTEC